MEPSENGTHIFCKVDAVVWSKLAILETLWSKFFCSNLYLTQISKFFNAAKK